MAIHFILMGVWILAGTIAYLWSIGIALEHGLIAAALTFLLPPFAQIYWAFKLGLSTTYAILLWVTFGVGPLSGIIGALQRNRK